MSQTSSVFQSKGSVRLERSLSECHHQVACMTGVTVDEAFRACDELLKNKES